MLNAGLKIVALRFMISSGQPGIHIVKDYDKKFLNKKLKESLQ